MLALLWKLLKKASHVDFSVPVRLARSDGCTISMRVNPKIRAVSGYPHPGNNLCPRLDSGVGPSEGEKAA